MAKNKMGIMDVFREIHRCAHFANSENSFDKKTNLKLVWDRYEEL